MFPFSRFNSLRVRLFNAQHDLIREEIAGVEDAAMEDTSVSPRGAAMISTIGGFPVYKDDLTIYHSQDSR